MTPADVRFGSLADICSAKRDVRFTPESGHSVRLAVCPLCANSGHRRPERAPQKQCSATLAVSTAVQPV